MCNHLNKTTLIYRYIFYKSLSLKPYFIITLSLLLIINSVSQTYSAPYVDNLSKDYTFNIGQEVDLIYNFDFGIDPDFRQMGMTWAPMLLQILVES